MSWLPKPRWLGGDVTPSGDCSAQVRATSVDINIDDDELQDARWFTVDDVAAFGEWGADIPDDMPRLPRKDSIARWLIETWRDEHT